MLRIVLGVLKGGILGGGVGYLATRAGIAGGVLAWGVYALVGALVGVVCGRAPWRHETIWTPILKAFFVLLVGMGLYFGARKLLGGVHLPLSFLPTSATRPIPEVPAILGPLIGILYGVFVEIDDRSGGKPGTGSAAPSSPKK